VIVRRDTSITLSIGVLPDQQARNCEAVASVNMMLGSKDLFAFERLEKSSLLGTKP
jgi:hypothetical protein